MRKLNVNWTVKQFLGKAGKNEVSFDYPIQRKGSQWDLLQKSVLIHSLVEDFPVPAFYSIEEEVEVEGANGKKKKQKKFQILDGKQRLSNIKDFINNEYPLHPDTPIAHFDGEEIVLADKIFDELPEEVQDFILSFSLLVVKLEDATDDQIEEVFYRLNNGTPLSKQQKAKAKMGAEWAGIIKTLIEHPLMVEKASFTELQLRKADDEMAILQTMFILDEEVEWKSIASNEVFDYAKTFKGNDKKELVEKMFKAFDYLNEAFTEKETLMLKKVHFPMTIITALKAIDMGIDAIRFNDWKEEFKLSLKLKSKANIPTDYKKYGGQGSVKKEKTTNRINAMGAHLDEYFKVFSMTALKPEEETKAEVKEVVEPENKKGKGNKKEEKLEVVEPTQQELLEEEVIEEVKEVVEEQQVEQQEEEKQEVAPDGNDLTEDQLKALLEG